MLQLVAGAVLICMLKIEAFKQNGYTLVFERAELISYNHKFFYNAKVVSFKHNRTTAAMNITLSFKKDISKDYKLEVQAYKFASNEYREFPLRFAYDFCESLRRNEFGNGKLLECGNMTTCPPKKGNYFFYNFTPDVEKYPPLIPDGSYMLDLKMYDLLTEIAFIRAYGIVKTKYPWELK